MDFIWLIVGGIAGLLASLIIRTDAQQGIFLNIAVGIVGALLAGWTIASLLGVGAISQGFSMAALLTFAPSDQAIPFSLQSGVRLFSTADTIQ